MRHTGTTRRYRISDCSGNRPLMSIGFAEIHVVSRFGKESKGLIVKVCAFPNFVNRRLCHQQTGYLPDEAQCSSSNRQANANDFESRFF